MALPLVMIKKRPRRSVELTYHSPFGPVYYESPSISHHREGAEIDFLLFNIPDASCVVYGVGIKHNQSDCQSDRGFIGHPFIQAIFFTVLDIFKFIFDKFKRRGFGKVMDGKNASKRPLKPHLLTIFRQYIFLQESFVRSLLHVNQIRGFHNLINLPETSSYTSSDTISS